ncbi:MAG TPA: GLUG motif-containing protein [Sedimentisphaerales bacterium]|nr:GLUG motif-containing protein [Sedimentisphaerales bacterium]
MWCGTNSGRKAAVIVMTFWFVLPAPAADFAGGTGEPDNPYQIATAGQLMSLRSDPNLLNKCFVLTADLDLDPNLPGGKVFEEAVIAPRPDKADPRYLQDTSFSGVFDGRSHVVRNLAIQGASFLGLFGQNSGTIRNLGMVDARIGGSGDSIGALVGYSSGTVTECHCSGIVVGGSRVGGVIGRVMTGRMIRCRSDVKVTALGESAGGLAGQNAAGRILMSCSTGSVCGQLYVGGAVGTNEEGHVVHCYATGAVTGSKCVAGLIGFNRNGSVIQCYSAGLVTSGSDVGGLISWNSGAGRTRGVVDGCFWDTESSGQTTSGAGIGRTTAQMHDIETFLAAGWDFVDEDLNGACGYWWMPAGEYPRLCWHDGAAPVMPEGSGTAEEPYLIRDANDLGTVWFEPQAHYRLESSIDLSGIAWSVAVVPWFAGGFDGNGYVISNLRIEGHSYLGLFGESSPEAAIFNLGLETADVHGSGNHVGALAGCNRGGIASSSSTGTIAGAWQVGGLAGRNEGSITASQTTATVHADGEDVGGLVGTNFGSVAASHSAGAVSGHGRIGGLVGRCDRDGSVHDSYSVASVDGNARYVGGLVGYHSGSIAGSHSVGTVVGGDHVGGLVGSNSGTVAASYSRSMVSGRQLVGGFAGFNGGDISMSYSTGFVSGRDSVGGLVGTGRPQGVTSSFWDIETSGQAASVAGTGKTTAEMQAAATFLDAGWDFEGETVNGTEDLWWILDGQDYPRLWWELDGARM